MLNLYGALKNRQFPSSARVFVNTLDETPFTSGKNDLSFTVDGRLVVLIEYQSTPNLNMAFRCLATIARVFADGVDDKKALYRRKRLALPRPEFIVLYTGREKWADSELKLSDSFKEIPNFDEINLELKVKVFAIRKGKNDALLARDERLRGYAEFKYRVEERLDAIFKADSGADRKRALDEAINYAVDYCIKHGILRDFFTALDEGDRMNILTEYARDLELQAVKEDGFEEGIERGIERGVETERGYVLGLIRQGLSAEEIGRRLAGVI